ncbi:hypothetical protein Tco_1301606 [Tanacetum coccineum]
MWAHLDKMPQEGLAIIESKSKVRYSRSRANDSRCCFYDGPPFQPASGEKESEATKDTELPSTKDIQPPPLVQEQTKDKEPIEEPSFIANKAKPNFLTRQDSNKQKMLRKR